MATTRIIPMHHNKGKSMIQSLSDRTDYAENMDKTENGKFISSYACHPETAASEFALSKREYRELTGRIQISDVIAYQVRQSFKPGEVSPEEANRIGYEFAERFLKGNHSFIVCTHIDKAHIHNHIIWNSTNLSCTGKFRNFWNSTQAVQRLSDQICVEHRLSVVKNPSPKGKSYNKWLGDKEKLSNRDMLKIAIDNALRNNPKSFEEFLGILEKEGYQIKMGKHLSFRHKSQRKSIRLRSLGDGYSEEVIRLVIKKKVEHKPFNKKKYVMNNEKPSLISEIEARINSGKGYWYDQKLKVLKLKQMAKTIVYLEEKGFKDFRELSDAVDNAGNVYFELKEKIKSAEEQMTKIQNLKNHIINYSKTREVYVVYRKSGYSKKYLAEHESDILLHKASKKAFNEFGVKKLPTIKELHAEYSKLVLEKKESYAKYHKIKDEMRELSIHKANVARMLDVEKDEKDKERKQELEEK